jgi:hypothetical protein
MSTGYKRFSVIIDVKLDDKKYDTVSNWEGIEPVDFVRSVIQDHAEDRGLLVNINVVESDNPLVDRLMETREKIMKDDAFKELEDEIIANNKFCVGGNCED